MAIEKPVVRYDTSCGFQFYNPWGVEKEHPILGGRARVKPIDHPGHGGLVSNTKHATTSKIVATGENFEFETLNTRYVPFHP